MIAEEIRISSYYDMANARGDDCIERFTNYSQFLDIEIYGTGIPLTPELLQEANFEDNGGSFYLLPDYRFCIETVGNNEYQLSFDNHNIGKPFRYLHQLQNLYFALTGEELKIQL